MNRSTILLLLATLLVGGVLGYAVGSGSQVTGVPTGVPEPSRPAGASEDPPGARKSAGDAPRTLADVVPEIEYETGTGVITGLVREKIGTPVAGVLVRAERTEPIRPRDTGAGAPEDPDIGQMVRELVEWQHLVRATRREAVTDAEGRYTLEGLADFEHRLSAYGKGYQITGANRRSTYRIRPGATVNFTAQPVVRLPVRVLLPGGDTADQARVRIMEVGRGGGTRSWRPDYPPFALRPGKYEILAIAGRDDELTSPKVVAEYAAGDEPEMLLLETGRRPGVRGKVVATTSGNCEVKITRLAPGTDPDPQRLVAEGQRKSLWNDSRFEFRDLKPGKYLLGVIINRNQVVDHVVLDLQGGLVEQDLRGSAADPESFVVVRVEGPDGKLVRRAVVSGKYLGARANRSVGRAVEQDDGTYRLPFKPLEERNLVPGGRYYAEVFTRAFGTARVEFDPESPGTVTIRYAEASRLQVTLAGYTDSPYQGATRLQISEIDEARGLTRYTQRYGFDARLSDEGVKEYGGVQPGLFEVGVRVKTDGGGDLLVATERVRVGPGEKRHTFTLPPLHTQTVLVGGDAASLRFRLSPRSGLSGYWGTGLTPPESGRFVFRRLPAGEYELTGSGGRQSRTMFFTVPGRKAFEFEPVTVNALRVAVGDGSGSLAAADLRDGDLVVGIGGEEFKDRAHMDALLKLARTKESVELTVLRGRSRLKLAADLRRYWEEGGKLQPSAR